MTDLIRSELLKLRTVRSFWWSVAAALAFVPASVALAITGSDGRTAPLASGDGFRNVLAASAAGAVVVLILGILMSAGEFRHGTVTSTFLVSPDRARVVRAKLAAAALVGAAIGVASSAVALAVALPWLSSRGVSLSGHWGDAAVTVAGAIAATAISGLVGVGLGALVPNQTLAITVALVWSQIVEGLLVVSAPGIGRWLPGGTAAALGGADHGGLLPVWAAALLFTAYGLAFSSLGTRFVLRRDVA
jgi:ABC-2 type transport system permease protein